MKICTQCDTRKPRDKFHKKARASDGLSSWCKACKNSIETKRQQAKRETLTHEQREIKATKKRAHKQVETALYKGSLIKPKRCECCNKVFPPREIHGHHHDYAKPLEVEWVCRACHYLDHGERLIAECETCSVEFEHQRGEKRAFCSHACWHKSDRILDSGRLASERRIENKEATQ